MKDSDSISKKSSSDSENLVNKIVPEMPIDKRTKAYKEWVKKYGQEASDSNEIPDMPKDKRTKAYKEWVKQYGVQEVTSDKSEKKSSKKVSKSKTKTSGLDKLVSDFNEKINSDDWFNKRKDIEELRSKINSTLPK